ncbi:MAG: type II toxin-antitoxin system RelE/ParE family toxin [Fibrobacter sp.]|nr:type II toxin-antitoxin system RelE/ParE family toxin [Fibrobacter sp.]
MKEIVDYYKTLNSSYVESVIAQFEHNILSLSHFPLSGRVVPELYDQGIELYREIIQGLYRIVYEIQTENVIVHAVIDSRRNLQDILVAKLFRL